MANVSGPVWGSYATGSLGWNITLWKERTRRAARGLRARRRTASVRQETVMGFQRSLFEDWHDLTDGERASWDEYCRTHRVHEGGRSWVRSSVLSFASHNQILLDRGLSLSVEPPRSQHVVMASYMSSSWPEYQPKPLLWVGGSGGLGVDDFFDVWVTRLVLSVNRRLRWYDWRHLVYMAPTVGIPEVLPLTVRGRYWVRARGVNRYGVRGGVWAHTLVDGFG